MVLLSIEMLSAGCDLVGQIPQDGIVFQQVSQSFRVGQIVGPQRIRYCCHLSEALSTFRPMRPNPLIPTLIAM